MGRVRHVSGGERPDYAESWKEPVLTRRLVSFSRTVDQVSGVYIVVADHGEVIKAGKSSNLGSRLRAHATSSATWDRDLTSALVIKCQNPGKWEIELLKALRYEFPDRIGNETFSEPGPCGCEEETLAHERQRELKLSNRLASIMDGLRDRIAARGDLLNTNSASSASPEEGDTP